MSSTLEGTKIVVIGGTSGIGFAVAKAAIFDHAAEVIVVSSTVDKVSKAVERLQELRRSRTDLTACVVTGEVVDASKSDEVKQLFVRIGEIDHLVFTSGGGIENSKKSFKEQDLETMRDMLDLKFWGAATSAQAARFRDVSASSSLTLTTGSSHFRPPPGWALLAGDLGAVDALGRGLAVDLAPVRVNVICPGYVKTELWDTSGVPRHAQDALFEENAKRLLVKHVADADEIVDAYLFVMKCRYITGQTIQVDGGYSLI